MKPFSGDLNAQSAGRTAKNVYLGISAGARWAIELWRVLLFIMWSKSSPYRRRLESFAPRPPVYLVEFDASLKGMGLVISSVGDDRQLTCSRVVSMAFPFDLKEKSDYQNAMEFTCLAVAFAVLASSRDLKAVGQSIEVRGDSMSALKWASSERFRTGKAQNAAMVFIAIGTRYDPRVEGASHIAGEKNIICDNLSRGVSPLSLGYDKAFDLKPEEESAAKEALALCNPLIVHPDSPSFSRFYRDVDRFSSSLGRRAEDTM